jgi:hypothetical protein
MKKTTIIWIAITLVVFLFSYFGLATFLMIKTDIHDLVRHSYNRDSGGFPLYPKGIAEFYIFKFRGNEEDLASLKAGKGLGYILAVSKDGEANKTMKYLQFFLDKGFDINSIDGDGFTVLHKAVLYNKPKSVAFLLNKSADPDVEIDMSDHSARVGVEPIDRLNALEYAIYLTEEKNQDRHAIIAMIAKRQQS